MKYRESQIDKDLRQWFMNDFSKALLRKIRLRSGSLRGINALDIKFDYPITAFSGINGAGKSTILALAACAYHGNDKTFKLSKRKTPYYTFSDFFVQHTEEVPPEGLEIGYHIAHDGWKKTEYHPEGKGIGVQTRRKPKGGKWNDYDSRVKKCVIFLGIERIVPHIERSQSRSYSKSFSNTKPKGWENKVRDTVGSILGKTYDDFRYLEHSKYSLPIVKVGDITYSGFNMGAGENALFEIFSVLYSCQQSALLIIDEIELGLHAKAQSIFIKKLKEVCKETGTQVIRTTHSKQIFECLPDDARYFVESIAKKTKITLGISPEFAFSKMSSKSTKELDIFVEDEVAQAMIEAALPAAIRARIRILVIGSANAISRQLAAIYARGEDIPAIAIFDGDQRIRKDELFSHAKKMAENTSAEFSAWFFSRIAFIPGETWPEAWIIQKCKDALKETRISLSLSEDGEAADILEYGLQAGKHNEFFEISKYVGLDKNQCLLRLAATVYATAKTDFDELTNLISKKIS